MKRGKRYGSRTISKEVRDAVRKRDDNRCVYCGKKESEGGWFKKPVKLQYGHYIPHSKGGTVCFENIQLECYACNINKGTEEWELNWFKRKFIRGTEGCKNKKCKHLK